MSKILSILLFIIFTSFSYQSSIGVPKDKNLYQNIEGYKKYFGFPNFLSGRRSPNWDANTDAEPRKESDDKILPSNDAEDKDANLDQEITDLSQLSSAASNHELLNTINLMINSRKSCPENHFQCSSSSSASSIFIIYPTLRDGPLKPKCIPDDKICDGVKDCPNFDDESEHRCRCWQEINHYKCKGSSPKCIPKDWLCDNVKDCSFGDDEDAELCVNVSNVSTTTNVTNGYGATSAKLWYICQGPFFKYQQRIDSMLIPLNLKGHRTMIPVKWLCDGHQDCEKGDDEKFCDVPYPSIKNGSESINQSINANGSQIVVDDVTLPPHSLSFALPSSLAPSSSTSRPSSSSLRRREVKEEKDEEMEEEVHPLTTPFIQ